MRAFRYRGVELVECPDYGPTFLECAPAPPFEMPSPPVAFWGHPFSSPDGVEVLLYLSEGERPNAAHGADLDRALP